VGSAFRARSSGVCAVGSGSSRKGSRVVAIWPESASSNAEARFLRSSRRAFDSRRRLYRTRHPALGGCGVKQATRRNRRDGIKTATGDDARTIGGGLGMMAVNEFSDPRRFAGDVAIVGTIADASVNEFGAVLSERPAVLATTRVWAVRRSRAAASSAAARRTSTRAEFTRSSLA